MLQTSVSIFIQVPHTFGFLRPSAVADGVLKMLIACEKSYPQVDKRDW